MTAIVLRLIAWVVAAWLTAGATIVIPCLLYALWCRVSPALHRGLAWARYRTALLLGRPVPDDGLPLDVDEARAFIDAVRAWDLRAAGPARQPPLFDDETGAAS